MLSFPFFSFPFSGTRLHGSRPPAASSYFTRYRFAVYAYAVWTEPPHRAGTSIPQNEWKRNRFLSVLCVRLVCPPCDGPVPALFICHTFPVIPACPVPLAGQGKRTGDAVWISASPVRRLGFSSRCARETKQAHMGYCVMGYCVNQSVCADGISVPPASRWPSSSQWPPPAAPGCTAPPGTAASPPPA